MNTQTSQQGTALIASDTAVSTPSEAGIPRQWLGMFAEVHQARRALVLAVQLGLLALIVRQFRIESTAFLQVCLLAFGGALLQEAIPRPHRLSFFALLSLASIALVFGLRQGALIVASGLALIGICHLPAAFRVRVLVLALAAGVLAALRLDWISGPWSRAVWPILGSMFMFRLIVYMYDLRHETGPKSLARTTSYFFLLPNVCFPMFPVVDYKTFKRTYCDVELDRIQQVGIQWILRGVIQLILYRVVYYYLTMSPADVTNPGDLGRFLVANYLLYLRISGQFHVIVGILRLFGFNLPETHHRYLLASSINDFWRRINIYWKDFMMKLFYYPSFFALRKRRVSERASLVIATLVVFVATWLLHSYQWFWLRGSFPLTWPDALFWGILGLLVVANTLHESSRGRARRLGNRKLTVSEMSGVALRTALTFCFICVLWSLWTAESVSQWFSLWTSAFENGITAQTWHALSVGAAAAGVTAIGASPGARKPQQSRAPGGLMNRTFVTTAAIAALFLVGHPRVYTRLDARLATVMDSLREQKLNRQDAAMLEAGYYENLLSVERFNSQLWELYSKRPAGDANLRDSGGMRQIPTFLVEELIPSLDITFKGVPFQTNSAGMRDDEYTLDKPAGTRRIVVLGPSDAMGTGVLASETFASVLERRLGAHGGYEVLNLSTSNYTPPQHLWLLEHRGFAYSPDAVVLVGHDDDADRASRHLATVMSRSIEVPYQELREFAERAGVTAGMPESEARRRLKPYSDEIVAWTYRRIADLCRERGATPVWVFLPFLVEDRQQVDEALKQHAASAGFMTLDYSGLYRGKDIRSFRVAEYDLHHPNVAGHTLIGERLFRDLSSGVISSRLGLDGRNDSTKGLP